MSLSIWLDGEPGSVNAVTDIIAKFMQEHPGITVDTTFVGNALINPTLVPAPIASAGPDIWMGGADTHPISWRQSQLWATSLIQTASTT